MRITVGAIMVLLAACSSAIVLTDEGQTVRRVTDAEKPGGCSLLGDVAIGVPPDAARPRTEDELVMLMRNKAGEADGTHLVVDSTEQRDAQTERPYWIGRGRAYRCPEETTPPETPAPAATEGGEEPAGEAEGAEERDAVTEDLLSD